MWTISCLRYALFNHTYLPSRFGAYSHTPYSTNFLVL
nr:MAG TPA: hypothetical protein [Caudoviricetes sp.]